MDKTSKSKKIWLEITLNVKNADMDQTMNNKKTLTGKTSNRKNVDKGTKGEDKKHQIYVLESTLRDHILIHTEDNSSLKEINDTIQMHIL
jgi:cell fate (sporulation/competence/biofilm development) regulator YmcA (YheA/YmcA/DUF963 family)